MRKTVLFLALFSLLFASCRTRVEYETKAGLTLQLSTEGEFTKPIYTKAEDDFKVNVNDFKLTISKASTGETVLAYDAFSDVPSIISIEPGVYNLRANSPGTEPVAWFQPIYRGSSDNVSVSAGRSQNVSIVCKLTNMKVTVKVTDRFISEMQSDFEITVANEDGFLTWNKNAVDNGNSGYYSVKPLTLDIKAIRKTTGDHINHHIDIVKVAAQDHHILTIDASETGDIEFGEDGIKVDYTVNNKEENIVIDGLEETPLDPIEPEDPTPGEPTEPGPENPNQPVEPVEYIKITCPGIDTPAEFVKGEIPKDLVFDMVIEAEKGIRNLVLDIESPALTALVESMVIEEPLIPADLANMTGEVYDFWGGTVFLIDDPQTEIYGQTSYTLSVGGLISFIKDVETHIMTAEVTDMEGNTKKVTITIIVKAA